MGEAFIVFLNGSVAVFAGMGLVYLTIRLTAIVVAGVTRGREGK